MHSSGFFWIKLIARLILKCEISRSHTISNQSLLLSTMVLNDRCIGLYCSIDTIFDQTLKANPADPHSIQIKYIHMQCAHRTSGKTIAIKYSVLIKKGPSGFVLYITKQ